MDVERFEQFKRESDIVIKVSVWLTREIDKVIEQQTYYEEHPYLDTYELMEQRIRTMSELQQRSSIEGNIYHAHHTKYRDLFNSEI